MPSEAQGVVLFVSDHCETLKYEEGRYTATAGEWLKSWKKVQIPYANLYATGGGLSQCLSRADNIFSGKSIYKVFVSPLPNTLDKSAFDKIQIEALPEPAASSVLSLETRQELLSNRVRVFLSPVEKRKASLIFEERIEAMGDVEESVDLIPNESAWLWLQKEIAEDPWAGQWIVPIQYRTNYEVTVWAQKESPGFISLITALKSHPDIKVVRQIGGRPSGDPLIIYGSYSQPRDLLGKTWFFLSFDGMSSFKIRDKKSWTAGALSSDLRKSFILKTQDGEIFVKKYLLLDLDLFNSLESFEDGAPSLLQDQRSDVKHWVSPFSLEDLTTDLTLEPTFIPYLYRHLERWLAVAGSDDEEMDLDSIWTMPGAVKPTAEVLRRLQWPGIYGKEQHYKIVGPLPMPTAYFSLDKSKEDSALHSEDVSQRPLLYKYLAGSTILELFLCGLGARFLSFLLIGFLFFASPAPLEAAETLIRKIPIGIFSGIDMDRKKSLIQFPDEVNSLSNLDFDKPNAVNFNELWKYSIIVASSTKQFGPFTPSQREKLREYCERGGLLVFDDPLASSSSSFYKSVRKELAAIFPGRPLSRVPKDDVLFRTYYLLSEVSGRKLASPYLEGIKFDKRWVAVFSFNDLLGASLRNARGEYAFSVSPYGVSQRTLAKRLLLNMMMYAVTIDYKNDAIHLPHILKRRER
jgi:hypothetical protein